MPTHRLAPFAAAALLALASCSKEAGAPPPASAPDSRFRLASEPAAAVSVLDAKAAAPKDDAAVVGRVREVSPGIVGFVLVDTRLTYCGEKAAEGDTDPCKEPWDYCCHPPAEIAKHSVAVAVRGAGGDVERGAIPELRPLDLVVVKGRLAKSEKGDVELVASGWYRKDRPKVGEHVQFP